MRVLSRYWRSLRSRRRHLPARVRRAARQDPQTANIPYVGWAGNQIRIAKCLGQQEMVDDHGLSVAQAQQLLTPGLVLRSSWTVEDWSGVDENNAGPAFLNAPNRDTVAYLDDSGRLCFSVHVSSLKPGMAVIKGAARIDLGGFTPGFDILGKHQFLVIWLRSQAPVIREVANTDFPSLDLGDPAGDGIFNPLGSRTVSSRSPRRARSRSGTTSPASIRTTRSRFPTTGRSSPASSASTTMPRTAAGRVAARCVGTSTTTTRPRRTMRVANYCTPRAGTVDAVDNCFLVDRRRRRRDGAVLALLRLLVVRLTVGPFDPVRDFDTLLSDNKLDAWDAPMPALRVDVRIAAGGIGSLEKADKDNIYVRDRTKADNTPHNLYAPFYQAYIPAAGPSADFSDRSGVAGAFVSNNFPGFQNDGGVRLLRHVSGEWTTIRPVATTR